MNYFRQHYLHVICNLTHKETAATAHFSGKQLLLFAFAYLYYFQHHWTDDCTHRIKLQARAILANLNYDWIRKYQLFIFLRSKKHHLHCRAKPKDSNYITLQSSTIYFLNEHLLPFAVLSKKLSLLMIVSSPPPPTTEL